PVVGLGYFALTRQQNHLLVLLWLIVASLFFYAYWNPPFLLLLLFSIGVNYKIGTWLKEKPKTGVLTSGIAFNLLLIGVFKYAGFFLSTVNSITGTSLPTPSIVLPLAISFFTFQQIAYLVDVYQGKVKDTNIVNYMLFVSFFPQLIAGPIVHHNEIIPQFVRPSGRRINPANIVAGAAVFIIGLQKKIVIADGLAVYADSVFAGAAATAPTLAAAWTGALAFSFQIYFDFSGYTDMAIGLALMFSIRLPENFESPYKAVNIIDFWRRWHMTLSRFLREYLYIPLGGNRGGAPRHYVNVMVTMLLGGLWHGASWNFVIWGGLHGLFLVTNHGWRAIRRRRGHHLEISTVFGRAFSRTITLLAVVFAWVLFRAETMADAIAVLRGMVGLNGFDPAASYAGLPWLAVFSLIVLFFPNTREIVAGETILDRWRIGPVSSWTLPIVGVFGCVAVLLVIVKGSSTSQFIYMVF
ncbi:MAG: MBOAT family protein, partial [Proteobacteria bacterium]|nr:MBOAT family protein [Pseudomonadota bacterium]